MKHLTLADMERLHKRALRQHGGSPGIREPGGLESALAQPQMTFGGEDFYSTLAEKAAALGFSLINNHPFVDANKRVAHAAMEALLDINGQELVDIVDTQEQIILSVAAGTMEREEFTEWVVAHVHPKQNAHKMP